MTNSNKTEIIALMDRSGSMSVCKDAMMKGWHDFIADQRKLPGECLVTLARFDEEFELVYVARDIHTEPPFVLEPRGWTALVDALCTTIDAQGARMELLPERTRAGKVVFLVFTDGLENSSKKFQPEDAKQRIKHQTEKYGWQFVYIGAHVDAFTEAERFGFARNSSMRSGVTGQSIVSAYSSLSRGTTSYRGGMSSTVDVAREVDDEGKEQK